MSGKKQQSESILKFIKGSFYFPWLTILSCISFLILVGFRSVNLIDNEQILPWSWAAKNSEAIMIIVVIVLLVAEYSFFHIRMNKTQRDITRLNQQVRFISKSKKKQQQRANQYSDHTEKLKGFIADKLIEYMDYDEKFIHFKGIAAEVRHNGVISYDKITTALNKAIEQQGFLSLYEQQSSQTEETSQQTLNALVDYQGAVDAMRYLWALLDLSTADNMAMHIGNQLIECEENYYRLQLDQHKTLDITQSIPVEPTFNPQMALLTTFSLLINEQELNNRITLGKINPAIFQEPFYFENEQFRISITPTAELLGNQNHIILLLENLIKNAQFFSTKNRFRQKTDRINIQLRPEKGVVVFTIYNRGPHIESDVQEAIFRLGFSTRKSKENHGKGLGLFFAKEIVRGYQGDILAKNINEQSSRYCITIFQQDGTNISYPIICQFVDSRLQVKSLLGSNWNKEINLTTEQRISTIEVSLIDSTEAQTQSHCISDIDSSEKIRWLDPTERLEKRWIIELSPFKKSHNLLFKPLAIAGVQFELQLPTAESHLEL